MWPLYSRRQLAADVAELADAQPSGGCDRKVVEVQLLSSAPNYTMTMKLTHWTICSLIIVAAASFANAGTVNDNSRWTGLDKFRESIAHPLSPGSTVDMPTVDVHGAEIKSHSVPMRDLSTSPTPAQRELKTVGSKNVDVNRRELSTRDTEVRDMPQTNFTAKRSSLFDQVRSESYNRSPVNPAPVTKRRIVVSSPEGLEELKNQLNRIP